MLPLLKKSSGKICDFTQHFFADAPIKKKILPPLTALLHGTTSTKYFYALILKKFPTIPSFRVLGPPGTSLQTK